ncbi:opioid growth factor receptor-related protein [Scytonema sp. NUACC26]|uniref:opioid growth factor receptor-related protein n=1 Tax=Scytonema sp. NUACC26 TaxID=3140176 RepID=UPI0034DC0247
MKNEERLTATIVPFYLAEQPDIAGRMIHEIWGWDFDELEYNHDYIQWLFPINEKSAFNPYAPVLNNEVIQRFQTDSRLQQNLLQSFNIMLKFYGLEGNMESDRYIVTKAQNYKIRAKEWINFGNHNYLRITRILKCLMTLGCESYARAFYQCLQQIYKEETQAIAHKTFQFWTDAACS